MHNNDNSLRRAYVFGNVAVDEVLQVRELPKIGQSVLAESAPVALGGKGANQAIALARSGVSTTFVAAIGSDQNADLVRKTLAQEPMQCALIRRQEETTDRSIILADETGNNMIVTTNACARSVSMPDCSPFLAEARAGDMVLLQGNLRAEVTAQLCREAKRRNLVTVLNPSPYVNVFREMLAFTDILFVNETEAFDLTGLSKNDAARALLSAEVSQVVLTLGAQGSLLATHDQTIHVPATAGAAVDVTGAGDCFEGVALGSAIRRRCTIDATALSHASVAASMTIGRLGAVSALPTELEIDQIMQEKQRI